MYMCVRMIFLGQLILELGDKTFAALPLTFLWPKFSGLIPRTLDRRWRFNRRKYVSTEYRMYRIYYVRGM